MPELLLSLYQYDLFLASLCTSLYPCVLRAETKGGQLSFHAVAVCGHVPSCQRCLDIGEQIPCQIFRLFFDCVCGQARSMYRGHTNSFNNLMRPARRKHAQFFYEDPEVRRAFLSCICRVSS